MAAMAAVMVVVVAGWAVVNEGVDVVVLMPFCEILGGLDDVDGVEAELSDFWFGKRMAYDGGGSISS